MLPSGGSLYFPHRLGHYLKIVFGSKFKAAHSTVAHRPHRHHWCVFFPITVVWTHLHEVLLPKYSQPNGVNVMSGPVFDENFDGHVDASKTG